MSVDKSLGEVCEFKNFKRKPVTASDRKAGPYPYYGAASIQDYVNDYLFDGLHVLVGEDGTVQTADGRPMIQLVDGKFWVNNHAHILKCEDDLDTRYLAYALHEVSISPFVTGAAQPKVNMSNLKRVLIKWPSKKIRSSIAETGKSLDNRIALLRETNATLEAIAQALFTSWFVDFDPVHAKSEGKLPEGMDEATATLFPDAFEETELGMLPKGWRVDSFGNWIDVLETGRRPKGGVSGIDSGIPSIGAESVTRIGEFDYSKLKFVSSDFFSKMKAGKLQSKDVLLYKDGGKPGVFLPRVSMFGDGFPFQVCGINEHVFRIRTKKPLGQTFLYFWLWSDSVMHELKHRGGKAAIPGINQGDVKELKIALPEAKIANAFEEITSPLVSKILANAKSIKTLSDLRDTLLPRLISGRLPISDAETELERVRA
jgi:type I restriction enzyme S subunit